MLARIRESAKEKDEGFTLIELLVVIIIIGILAAIAIPVFLNQRKKGWDAEAKSDLRNAATAEETWLTDNNSYTTVVTPNLTGLGYKKSPNTPLVTVVSIRPPGTGTDSYCLTVKSNSGKDFWYDSAAGGFVNSACT